MCAQNDKDASRQIRQMVDFIKIEAKEKAHEIRTKVRSHTACGWFFFFRRVRPAPHLTVGSSLFPRCSWHRCRHRSPTTSLFADGA